MVSSIFSCAYLPFTNFLWGNVCSNLFSFLFLFLLIKKGLDCCNFSVRSTLFPNRKLKKENPSPYQCPHTPSEWYAQELFPGVSSSVKELKGRERSDFQSSAKKSHCPVKTQWIFIKSRHTSLTTFFL